MNSKVHFNKTFKTEPILNYFEKLQWPIYIMGLQIRDIKSIVLFPIQFFSFDICYKDK